MRTASLDIAAVNDAPSFWFAVAATVDEDSGVAGANSQSGWATSITPGPADESAQTVSFSAVADDAELFSAQPTLSPNGLLEYTLAPHANGSTTLRLVALDSAGASSAEAAASFTVTAVQDPPTAGDDAYLISDGLPVSITTAEMLTNDSDDDGDALSVVTASPSGNAVVFDGTTLTYDPGVFAGTDTIGYVLTDGTVNASGTITIT